MTGRWPRLLHRIFDGNEADTSDHLQRDSIDRFADGAAEAIAPEPLEDPPFWLVDLEPFEVFDPTDAMMEHAVTAFDPGGHSGSARMNVSFVPVLDNSERTACA